MMELFKKGLFTGLGIMVITTEEIEKKINSLVEKGRLTAEEGENLIKELIHRSEQRKTEFQERITASVKSAVASLDIADKTELDNLQARVSSLEDRVSTLETLEMEEKKKS